MNRSFIVFESTQSTIQFHPIPPVLSSERGCAIVELGESELRQTLSESYAREITQIVIRTYFDLADKSMFQPESKFSISMIYSPFACNTLSFPICRLANDTKFWNSKLSSQMFVRMNCKLHGSWIVQILIWWIDAPTRKKINKLFILVRSIRRARWLHLYKLNLIIVIPQTARTSALEKSSAS